MGSRCIGFFSFPRYPRRNAGARGMPAHGDGWAGQLRLTAWLTVLLMGLTVALAADPPAATVISAEKIERLGNPAAQRYGDGQIYARNVWDLQVFDGRVYVGLGNSNNWGPAPNSGPVDVWSYDPLANQFVRELVLEEGQIDRYRVVDDELLIPGHDPLESWALGNFYRYRKGNWEKYRTIPGGIHTFDIVRFQGDLFAALGAVRGAEVAHSSDDGQTWTSYVLPDSFRAYTLFTLDDRLYVSAYGNVTGSRIDVWTGSGFQKVSADLFPGVRRPVEAFVVRPVPFRGGLVYIGAGPSGDVQWKPFGLFAATSLEEIQTIPLPAGELPYDVVVYEGRCYLLTTALKAQSSEPRYLIRVRVAEDISSWDELFQFEERTFARSLEIMEGDFYFGLACEPGYLAPETGEIIRVRREVALAEDL